ncbi:MAG: beta strand repeat-containing protein, partial [Gammaproteobacteria bacterium]
GHGNYNNSGLTINRQGGANPDDLFNFSDLTTYGITVNNNTLLLNNSNIIANFTNQSGKLTINFVSTNDALVTNDLVNEIIKSIQYSNGSNDPPVNVNLVYSFDNGLGLTNSATTYAVGINIIQIDNAPVNTVPSNSQNINENTALVFAANNVNRISVADLDLESGNITVTLQAAHGTLAFSTIAGLTQVTDGSYSITATGNLIDINAALSGLTYHPNINYYGKDTISIVTGDNANTGFIPNNQAQLTANSIINININQYNVAPNINNLGSISSNVYIESNAPVYINNNSLFNISDTQLNLLNNGTGNYTGAKLQIISNDPIPGNDIFSIGDLSTIGLAVNNNHTAIVDVNNDAVATIDLSVAGKLTINFISSNGVFANTVIANKIIQAIQYSNGSNDPPSKINLAYWFDDGMGAQNSIITANTILNINRIDNAPVNNVPQEISLDQKSSYTFTDKSLSITDFDAEAGILTVNLSVAQGILSLNSIAGLASFSGNNTNTVTINGTLDTINNALNNLTYKPNINFHGIDNLIVQTNDNGNTGSIPNNNNSLITTNTVNIVVNQVNVAPIINNLGTNSVNNYIANGSPILINTNSQFNVFDNELNAFNPGTGKYNGSSLIVQRNGGADPDDMFSFGTTVTINNSSLLINNVVVAHFTNTNGHLNINFVDSNGSTVTNDMVNTVLKAIQYKNISNTPPASVNLSYIFDDGSGAINATATANINVDIESNNAIALLAKNSLFSTIGQSLVFSNDNLIQIANNSIVQDNNAINTVQLTVTGGSLTLSSNFTDTAAIISGANNSNTLTIQDTLQN